MSPAEIRAKVIEILADILRKRYRIQIPEDDYIHLATLSGTVKYLEPLMTGLQEK
jgi:acyl carrier protein